MFTTGTATGHNDFLDKLRTYLTTVVGWTSLQYTPGVGNTAIATAVLRAPGALAGSEYYLYLETGFDLALGAYGISMRAATDYDSALPFAGQLGVSPAVWLNLWQNSIPYWIVANDRHVKIACKVNVSYMSAYAGLFLPYALPSEYPRPFYIGASYGALASHSLANTANRMIADPGTLSAYYLARDGVKWWLVENHNNDNTPTQFVDSAEAVIWPHRSPASGGLTSAESDTSSWNVNGMLSLRPNLSGNMPQFLCQIISIAERCTIGSLQGVYGIPGFGRTSEQLLTFSGRNFRCFQNTFRATARDFMSFEEI